MTTEVLVHANAGEDVGLGHLVRCTTLTKELLSLDITTELRLSRDEDAVAFARRAGVEPTISDVNTLRQDLSSSSADIVVVDSYDFTGDDFDRLADDRTLVVIDELGDRHVPADLVVNNNIYADQIEYPTAEEVLRGPKYCMLRRSFRELGEPKNCHPPESVLVTVGGADLADSFVKILDVTASVADRATINAVVGPYFSTPAHAPEAVVFHRQPSDIHELMWKADVAVSGGGQTLYELAACGTPTIALTLGDDQVRNIEGFETAGVCLAAGKPGEPTFEGTLGRHLETLSQDVETRQRMRENGLLLVDGKGAYRVAKAIGRRL